MNAASAPTRTATHAVRSDRRRPVRRAVTATALAALLAGAGVAVVPAAQATGGTTAPAADDRDQRPDHVQDDLEALVAGGFPGAEAFVRDADGWSRDHTAGVGNLETGAPVPTNGRVRVASNTKTFTAVVVLQLVGEGEVDLDAPVETYLPGLVRGEGIDGREITVRQLLQHTSGLPDYAAVVYADGPSTNLQTYFEPRDLLDAGLSQPATFAPGTSWGYSNTNYLLAGLIVQSVTERPVGEEITERVIDRAGLEDTYWPGLGELTIRGPHPRGYQAPEPGADLVDVTEQDTSAPWAAGALVSTPRDLSTFTRALLAGDLLEPAQLAEMETTVDAEGFEPEADWSYGLGIAKRTLSCGVEAWGHGGDIGGTETRNLTTEDGRSAVVAVTASPTSLEQVSAVNATVEDAICG